MSPVSNEALLEKIAGVRELIELVREQDLPAISKRLDTMNGFQRSNTQAIGDNRSSIAVLQNRMSTVEGNINRKAAAAGIISSVISIIASIFTPKP